MNFILKKSLLLEALLVLVAPVMTVADQLKEWVADRTVVERVYYNHRLGTKPPFEKTLPQDQITALVQADLKKEVVLKRVYGVEITPAMVEAEVQRINATTRAPEMLAEIKAALGNNPVRFARIVAKPIVVECTLRARFENDDTLHAPQRKTTEQLRHQVLSAKADKMPVEKLIALFKSKAGANCREVTWVLTPRPENDSSAASQRSPTLPSTPSKIQATAGPYSLEATAQIAQVLQSPGSGKEDRKFYFEDLPEELQRVLKAQLRQPGDVSAVIEMPNQFQLYLAQHVNSQQMTVLTCPIPKRGYEDWLARQSDLIRIDFSAFRRK